MASSTYMRAGRSVGFPKSSMIPLLMLQGKAGVISAKGSNSSHLTILMYFLCLVTKSGLLANTTVRASMARRNDSQLNADAVEPNTIAVARL